MRICGYLIWAIGATSFVPHAYAAPTRVAIVVGNNHGMSDELPLRYAESDAQKIQKVLIDLGGFESADVTLLIGANASQVRARLDEVARPAESTSLDRDTPLIFFYYSGHSDGRNLHMSGTKLPLSDLKRALASTGGGISIAVVDSCKSGALARSKGATLGPAYDIDFLHDPQVEGQIVITSSTEDEISQESDKIEGSFFTHHWVTGLYGAADANSDGLILLEEAYRYAYYRTIEETIASRGGVQHPSYSFAVTGQGNIVLASLTHSTAELEIRSVSSTAGEYYLLDSERQLVLTELVQPEGGNTVFRIPPGKYRVRKREPGRLLTKDIVAAAGERVVVSDADMVSGAYVVQSIKGAQDLFGITTHGPHIGAGLRSGIIDEMGPVFVLRGSYRLRWGMVFVEPRLVFRRADIDAQPQTIKHSELDFGLGLGIFHEIDPFRLSFGVDGGLVLFDQDGGGINIQVDPPQGAVPLGFQGGLRGEVGYRIVSGLVAELSGSAGLAVFRQGSKTETSLVFCGLAGIAYDF